MRPRSLSALVALALALCASSVHAQAAAIVGSWRGTSTCMDMEHWPACHNEQVIYDVRSGPGTPDTVTLRADKVVNGAREFMGESDFSFAPDSTWVSEYQAGSSRARVVLRIAGTHMTGTLVDVPSGRTVRQLALDRVH